ncbi:MAG: 16S rRNA (uracil(1498)-N(3))-methyltransferase [Gammaproteobacteria bacterium]|nr:16S rRNA (uracil(1498)-N(3))-methyltransferase [Gammaproteobacteria bacterium]
MRTLRFYIPQDLSVGDKFQAPENVSRHILQVLRLRLNDEVTLFNGNNVEYLAVISDISKKKLLLEIRQQQEISRESKTKIHLVQSISKGDRMDWVVQKAVELGVSSIQPVISHRTVVNLSSERGEKKLRHWQGIAIAACEQCGRNHLPEILPIVSLESLLPKFAEDKQSHKLILNPYSEQRIQTTDFNMDSFVLLVGPEGGLDDQEVSAVEQAGFNSYKMGPRILRTETAAISCITLLQALQGDL